MCRCFKKTCEHMPQYAVLCDNSIEFKNPQSYLLRDFCKCCKKTKYGFQMQQPANFSKKNVNKPNVQYPAPNRLTKLATSF